MSHQGGDAQSSSRIFRVVGPPGTGLPPDKTTYLARNAQRAATKHGADSVAIVSMTRTAAAEIGGRDSGVPDTNCSTLHAAALHALDTPDLAETPASMREFAAAHPAYMTGRDDTPEDAGGGRVGTGSALHVAVTNRRARMTPAEDWTDDERDYSTAWEDFKEQTKRADFNDLIAQCLRETDTHPLAPRVLMVDEAQDLSRLELALVLRWSADTDTTVIVGDSSQAIFSFRGADPHALDNLDVAGSRVLEQSYRVPRAVHDTATRWVSRLPGEQIEWKPRDADGQVTVAPYALRDTDQVIAAALDSVNDGQTTMVLATCRYMLTALTAQLRRQGVPFHNPWADETAWNPLDTKGARALTAYLQPQITNSMWTWGDLLDWTEPMQATHLPRGAKASIVEHCRTDDYGASHTTETVPLATLLTLLGETALDRAMSMDLHWWEGTLLARGARSVRYPLDVLAAGGAEALTSEPRLVISTVHGVKGATIDHVILAPELSKEAYWGEDGWLTGRAGHDSVVRMGYVAMTRARESLTILEAGTPESAPLDQAVAVAA